jgi:hypothetical protein
MRWLLALFLLAAAPACAQECRPFAMAIFAPAPGANLVQVAEGGLAEELLAFINSQPPATDYTGDRIAIFYLPASRHFHFVVAAGECAKTVIQLPASMFARIVGDPA